MTLAESLEPVTNGTLGDNINHELNDPGNKALEDNPTPTSLPDGQPWKIIVDKLLQLPTDEQGCNVFNSKNPIESSMSGSKPNGKSTISSKLSKPVFVVGSPRSGTTLVGNCLQAHSEMTGGDESLFLLHLWQIYSDIHQGINRRGYAPLAQYLDGEAMLCLMQSFAENIFQSILTKTGDNPIYVDHTPWYVGIIPFIKQLFPEARFVHVIRNGVDVVNSLGSSYKKGFGWCGPDIPTRSGIWKELVTLGRTYGSRLDSSEYMEVFYEDIVREPEQTLGDLLKRLGLKWDSNCLLPLSIEHAGPSRSNVVINCDHNGNRNIPEFGNKTGWTTQEKLEFSQICRETMISCNYSVE